ncbi:MAG: RNA polymerase sigma factor [Tepidisphaeraceae bacterium]
MQSNFGASTNPSIFLRLNASDAHPREVAWDEFNTRYVPMIAGFARRLGSKPHDVDDVIQDVMLGFFLKSPTFVYDSSKGRFRRYLKVCTYHALQKRFGKSARLLGKPLDEIDPESVAVEKVWNDVWEQELLRRAVDEIRRDRGHTRTFTAFELHVMLDEPAETVAQKLGLHIKSVYRAKDEISRQLKARLTALRDED